MGVASPQRAVPSAVLGTGDVTPLEMAGAYATLAAKGRRAAPFGVRRITAADGRVLYQARPDSDQAVAPGVAAIATDVLRRVVDHGTGVRGRIGRPAAAKTGTTQDHADAWFVGFTPSLAAAVWVGYPQGQLPMLPPRTRGRISGATWPASVWAGFMRAAMAGRPDGRFPRPDTSLAEVRVDVARGCLPNRFTPTAEVASVVLLKAAAPTRTCREPERPLPGVVPEVVGVPVTRAAGWLEVAGLSPVQRLRVDTAAKPGTVLAQAPAGGAARPPGAPVELTVAVDAHGNGGIGVTLVPEVLGQPEEAARRLLADVGLVAEVLDGCDADPVRAAQPRAGLALRPGPWRPGPGRGPGPALGSTLPSAGRLPPPRPRARRRIRGAGSGRRWVWAPASGQRWVGAPAAGQAGQGRRRRARRAGPGRPGETAGWPASRARQGRSAAAVTPTRPVQATCSSETGQPAVSSSGPRSRGAPLAQPARPRAWQRRAGPLARSRSRPLGRRARMRSAPRTGAPARSRTAWAVPSGAQTTFAHQCIP
jgi:membrane peptidoglycan carboxypeptidase